MNNPDFAKLTAAEKLNISEYRDLVYRSYPNESTCECTQAKQLSDPMEKTNNQHNDSSVKYLYQCPGGCKNSCCSRLRRSPTTNNDNNNGNVDKMAEESIASSLYCIRNQRTNGFYNSCYSLNERMRGGGVVPCDGFVQHKFRMNTGVVGINDPEHNSYWHRQSSHTPITSRFTDDPHGLCNDLHDDLNVHPMSGCCYRGREELIDTTAHQPDKKWKKPRIEIEKMIRALEDAQNFVNSLGKVPGVAGLGLMDPTESPYFHKNKQPTDKQSIMTMTDNNLIHSPMIKSQSGAPCNPHAISQSPLSPWIKATPFTISVPGRSGIVREAIFPVKQHTNESQQVIETGPCGEENCKSRHKTIINRQTLMKKVEGLGKSDQVVDKRISKTERRHELYRRRRRRKTVGKSSKERRINYVYFAGDVYPERVYGHKNCNQPYERVPANMGWFWTRYQPEGRLNSRIGWRPGTISKRIREMISEGKAGLETTQRRRRRSASLPSTDVRDRKFNTKSHMSIKRSHSRKLNEDNEVSEPPTLHFSRRDGDCYITMYPIRQETNDIPKLAEPIKPLQFIIPKRFDDCSETSSTTVSDMDIEFSPPAALNRYKKKPDVIHVEVQTKLQDIIGTAKPADNKGRELVEPEKQLKTGKKKNQSKKRK